MTTYFNTNRPHLALLGDSLDISRGDVANEAPYREGCSNMRLMDSRLLPAGGFRAGCAGSDAGICKRRLDFQSARGFHAIPMAAKLRLLSILVLISAPGASPARGGEPEDLAPLAVYLASPGSDFMTGQTIFLDGGQTVV